MISIPFKFGQFAVLRSLLFSSRKLNLIFVLDNNVHCCDVYSLLWWSTRCVVVYTCFFCVSLLVTYICHIRLKHPALARFPFQIWPWLDVKKIKSTGNLLVSKSWHCMWWCVTGKDFGCSKSHVFVLGPEDGHAKLADIARHLSSEVAMQRLSLDNLTISYVDSVVQGKSNNCTCEYNTTTTTTATPIKIKPVWI